MYSLSDVFCTTWLSESTFKKSYRTENFSCPLCDNSFRESPSWKKKKNIPLNQFKLDIAFSSMYLEASMLKQDAVTTRCMIKLKKAIKRERLQLEG